MAAGADDAAAGDEQRPAAAAGGVSPEAAERGLVAIAPALQDGPQTRDQLRAVLVRADVPVARQALAHVVGLASLRGLLVRGPVVDGGQAFVLVRDWLGAPPTVDRDRALAQLAHRYLAGHGPVDDRDLARWTGLPLRDARRGLQLVADDLVGVDGLLDLRRRTEPAPLPPPRLLGSFGPVLLGWTSRTDVVGPYTTLVTDNGIFRPFAMVDGRAVATWGYVKGRVQLKPLEPLDPVVQQALPTEATRVEQFL